LDYQQVFEDTYHTIKNDFFE